MKRVILDTDIGTDVDDALALGLLAASSELLVEGVTTVHAFSFLFSWNEFLIAQLFLPERLAMTLPVGVQMFTRQFSTDWGSLMAAATLTMVPTFVLFLFVQKYVVSGAVAGSVKG